MTKITVKMKNNLAFYRHAAGLTQYDVSDALGIEQPYYSQIEIGHRYGHIKFWLRAATFFGLKLDDLVEDRQNGWTLEERKRVNKVPGFTPEGSLKTARKHPESTSSHRSDRISKIRKDSMGDIREPA